MKAALREAVKAADEESQRKYAEEALASAESEIEEAAHLVSAMEKGR